MKLQDLKSLSKECCISVFTFRKFVKIGMPHYRIGRKILVDSQEFEDWFEKFKVVSNSRLSNIDELLENIVNEVKQNFS